MSKKPNFFFIGGMRCGSTSINLLLDQHPDIFMSPIKEPRFFEAELLRSKLKQNPNDADLKKQLLHFTQTGKHREEIEYLSLFSKANNERYIGESSHYLYNPEVAKLIKEKYPNSKILISIRNPVDRLFSEYSFYTRRGSYKGSFKSFLLENADVKDGVLIEKPNGRLNKGLYFDRVRTFIQIFGEENVKVIIFEKFIQQEKQTMDEVYEWLGIDQISEITLVHAQKSGKFTVPLIKRIISNKWVNSKVKKIVPKMWLVKIREIIYKFFLKEGSIDNISKALLNEFYIEDRIKLTTQFNLDLDHWQ